MRKRGLILSIVLIVLLLFQTISYAQTQQITNGLNYLFSTQNPDGSWNGTLYRGRLSTTINIIRTLSLLGQENTPAYTNALLWLQAQQTQDMTTTDYLSERMHALSVTGSDENILLSYLDHLSGGWGFYDDYGVNNLDTVLALRALKRVSYQDQNTITSVLNYLTSNQNADGGWGFDKEMDSEVYYTALFLSTLSQFKSIYDLKTPINNAVAHLLTKQNADGGFGEGGGTPPLQSPSTVYETALVFEALIASGAVGADNAQAMQIAINYLTSTQLPNGSWDDDPYSTALALRALANVKPNLSISSNDITFSTPTVGETITVTANIKNAGTVQADNILSNSVMENNRKKVLDKKIYFLIYITLILNLII